MVRRLSLCALIIILLSAPALAKIPRYTVTDLGTLGGRHALAHGLNNRGEVCGSSATVSGKAHAFVWSNGHMRDLGTLGGSWSVALGINDHGQVVGRSEISRGYDLHHACAWPAEGGIVDLGGWSTGQGWAINNDGAICGSTEGDACMWVRYRQITVAKPPNTRASLAFDINSRMQVVGQLETKSPPLWRAFIWQNGVLSDMGTLGGDQACARAINERGQVTGWSSLRGFSHAFIWENGVMSDLGEGWALDINNRGEVLGYGGQGMCIWRDGVMCPLQDLVPESITLWQFVPQAINDVGQILLQGSPQGSDAPSRSVLLTPIPVREVQIDIMPGEERNAIGLSWRGTFGVAVFTTPEFDAADVDAKNVELAGALSVTRCLRDVDRDGDRDLLLNFRYRDLHLTENSTEATLMGTVPGEYIIEGTDSVDIIHPGRWGR